MKIDGWDIDGTEVLDSNYEEGTIFTVADLIKYVVSHPLEFKPKVRCTDLQSDRDLIMEETDPWKAKLIAFLKGLEMRNINELIEEHPADLYLVARVMIIRIKDLKKQDKTGIEEKMKAYEQDPQYKAERAVSELTECFYEINPNPGIIAKWTIKLIEWLTDKVIYGWRK